MIIRGEQIAKEEKDYYKATTDINRTMHRNNIIGLLLTPTNEFYRRYMSAFYGNNAYLKTGLETATGILSGAAAITSPAGAKSILAALSTAVGGFGSSLEKNVLQQQTTSLIFRQMEADVTLYGEAISQGLAKPDSQYSLAKAYFDFQRYSLAMSVPHALSAIGAASGAQLNNVKKDIIESVSTQAKANNEAVKPLGQPVAPLLVPPAEEPPKK